VRHFELTIVDIAGNVYHHVTAALRASQARNSVNGILKRGYKIIQIKEV